MALIGIVSKQEKLRPIPETRLLGSGPFFVVLFLLHEICRLG